MRALRLPIGVLLGAALLLGVGARTASAQARWAIDRFAEQGVGAGTASTFRQLLRGQIASRNGASFSDLDSGCGDSQCARAAAAPSHAEVVVYGSLGRLGSKVVVSVTAVRVQDGSTLASETMGVDRVEDLDTAATRLAEAIVSGKHLEQTAELGTITHEEAKAPVRRDTRFGFTLQLEGIFPAHGYADRALGAGGGIGLWFESMDFVIEPRIGFRTELGAGERDWEHVPLEISLGYLLGRGDFAPLLGGGIGLSYVHEALPITRTVGSVARSTSTDVIDDRVFAFDAFARVGLLMLRTYDVSALVALDYAFTFADFQERSDDQALRVVVAVIIGGT